LNAPESQNYVALREAEINRLAACVEEFMDIPELMKLMS
jgi:cobyric acid synthase